MANGIEPKPVEHVRPPRVPSYQEQSRMRDFHTAAIGKEPNSTKPPCSVYPKARTYGIDGCSRNHHRLLHRSEVLSETGPMTMLPHADDGKQMFHGRGHSL